MDENMELQHWGIKGQKWGIRRYQNPDGTLTAAGKKRYYYQNPDGSLTEEGKKNYMTGARKGMINPKKLSDADLKMINQRFAAESNFNQNVQKYKESTFSYKAKQAVLNRLKGNGGGGGGGGKGGGKGGKGIASILTMPIKKALEDAFKFNPNTGNGKGNDDNDNDSDNFYKAYTKNGNRFVGSKTADKVAQILTNSDGVERGRRYVETARRTISVDANSGGRMGTYDATSSGTDYMNRRAEQRREAARKERQRAEARAEQKREQKAENRANQKREQDWQNRKKKEKLVFTSGGWVFQSGIAYRITRSKPNSDELMHYSIKGQKFDTD